MSFTFRLCNTLSGNFLRYQNIPDQLIIFCSFKLKFWLKLIHNLSLVLVWICEYTWKEFMGCGECWMFGCLWQPLHHFQTSFKMFSAREIFPNNKNEIFVQDCVNYVSVYLSLCWNTVIKIWAVLQTEDGENVIFTIQLRLRGFVRGHKNMSHIRKWRKIVLIIIKFYARKCVGRNVTTHTHTSQNV